MTIEIKAPTLPESVPDGTIAAWHKNVGDPVSRDELLVDIETDKVVIEVVSPTDGILTEILQVTGDTIVSNQAIGAVTAQDISRVESGNTQKTVDGKEKPSQAEISNLAPSPSAKKLMAENDLTSDAVDGTGKSGRITKEDVLGAISKTRLGGNVQASQSGRIEERVAMSRLRSRVAERLLHATQSTAMLTTFNEINMGPVMEIRSRYKGEFEKAHDGIRLGFMSFFVRAAIEALKRFPAVNASLDDQDIVYHGYQDIGIAVSSPRGLVVPVIRDADNLGLASIEQKISEFGEKARDGKLSIEEMTGGTFSISNGGVFGSLLSTPILNPPQTAILGMHKIQDRVMAVDGEAKILPMMYLALSYDHRMIDGKEAVMFLVAIKELIEDPIRLILEL
mgnify:CR=1 FL=1